MQLHRVKDQMGRELDVPVRPKRIVSLVPSQTELLFDLGLRDEVIGITKFCISPEEWFRSKTRIGGTKNVQIEKVMSLNPDLIIGNKEENAIQDIEALEKLAPVWMSDIYTLDDALDMIGSVGLLTGKEMQAGELLKNIREGFNQFKPVVHPKSVVYLIWNEPLMASGGNTFISDMLARFGLRNVYDQHSRYPVCDPQNDPAPDYVFLSSEPYPFNESHLISLKQVYPNSKLVLVDGEYFSWYGSRLSLLPAYFEKLKKQLDQA